MANETKYQLRIDADISKANAAFKRLGQTINGITASKSFLKIDPGTISNLTGQVDKFATTMDRRFQAISKSVTTVYGRLQKAISSGADASTVKKLESQFDKLNTKLVITERLSASISKAQRDLLKLGAPATEPASAGIKSKKWGTRSATQAPEAEEKGFWGALANLITHRGAIFIGSALGSVVMGMGASLRSVLTRTGPVGLGVMGAAGGAAMAYQLLQRRMAQAESGVSLRGMGVLKGGETELAQLRGGGSSFGYTGTQSLEQAQALSRQMGGGGVRAGGGFGGLRTMQMLQRGTGLSSDDLSPMAGSIRRSGVSSLNTPQTLVSLFSKAFKTGVDESRLLDFVKIQTDYMDKLSSDTNVNTDTLSDFTTGLLKNNKFFQDNAQRVGKVIEGLDAGWLSKDPYMQVMGYRVLRSQNPEMDPYQQMIMRKTSIFAPEMSEMFGGKGKGLNKFLQSLLGEATGTGNNFKGLKQNTPEWNQGQLMIMEMFKFGPQLAKEMMKQVQTGTFNAAQFKKDHPEANSFEERALKIMDTTDGRILSSIAILSNIADNVSAIAATVAFRGAQKVTDAAIRADLELKERSAQLAAGQGWAKRQEAEKGGAQGVLNNFGDFSKKFMGDRTMLPADKAFLRGAADQLMEDKYSSRLTSKNPMDIVKASVEQIQERSKLYDKIDALAIALDLNTDATKTNTKSTPIVNAPKTPSVAPKVLNSKQDPKTPAR